MHICFPPKITFTYGDLSRCQQTSSFNKNNMNSRICYYSPLMHLLAHLRSTQQLSITNKVQKFLNSTRFSQRRLMKRRACGRREQEEIIYIHVYIYIYFFFFLPTIRVCLFLHVSVCVWVWTESFPAQNDDLSFSVQTTIWMKSCYPRHALTRRCYHWLRL